VRLVVGEFLEALRGGDWTLDLGAQTAGRGMGIRVSTWWRDDEEKQLVCRRIVVSRQQLVDSLFFLFFFLTLTLLSRSPQSTHLPFTRSSPTPVCPHYLSIALGTKQTSSPCYALHSSYTLHTMLSRFSLFLGLGCSGSLSFIGSLCYPVQATLSPTEWKGTWNGYMPIHGMWCVVR
jgi:hypothetical protein